MSTKALTSIGTVGLQESLKNFIAFACDERQIEMSVVIKASIDLLNYCVTSREAVLSFYSELFEEFSSHYWMRKKANTPGIGANSNLESLDTTYRKPIEYVGPLTRSFYEIARSKHQSNNTLDIVPHPTSPLRERISPTKSISSIAGPSSPTTSQTCSSPNVAPKIIPTSTKVIPVSRRTSSCNSSNDVEQTPMSPTGHDCEIASLDNDGIQPESNSLDIFTELDHLIEDIKSAINQLTRRYNIANTQHVDTSITDYQRTKLNDILSRWSNELLIRLIIKQQELAIQVKNSAYDLKAIEPPKILASKIELWLGNPINKLLIDLLLDTHNDIPNLFQNLKVLSSTQRCDWLLAHILMSISERPEREKDFSSCMEFLIGCQTSKESVTHILAYLSDTNPKALANFPKSNILFLISLCQTSPSLLNIIALELPDKIDVDYLNNLAKEVFIRSSNDVQQSFIDGVTDCIMAAPNSYKLLLLAIDSRLDARVSDQVRLLASRTIDNILDRMHGRAIRRDSTQAIQIHLIDNLLKQIHDDPSKLIQKCPTSKLVEKTASEIFYKMSLIYGNQFASQVIGHYLNLEENQFWPLLKPLLKKYLKLFCDDGSTLISQTLTFDFNSLRYWNNVFQLTKMKMLKDLKLDLDIISQLLVDKLSATKVDIASVAHLIRLCESSLGKVLQCEGFPICISTTHRLSLSLATCFFLLLDSENGCLRETLKIIGTSQVCMSTLAKKSSVASQILCRALLERSLVYGHLFNENFDPDLVGDSSESYDLTQDNSIKLSKENLKITLGHRFRRLPNHVPGQSIINAKKFNKKPLEADTPSKIDINCLLLEEVFKTCIDDKFESFTTLFVNYHCPITLDKQSWANDEALRIIDQQNLAILRRFEQIPPFWGLYEYIGESKCLKSCMVLVKALLASHLAIWACATGSRAHDVLISTSRLIPPLAESGLIPKAFGLAVEAFSCFTPGEVYAVLSDIWQYLKDAQTNNLTDQRVYLHRLRLLMCQHYPGELYFRIFGLRS